MRFSISWPHKSFFGFVGALFLICAILVSGCSLSGGKSNDAAVATGIALGMQQTALAQTQAALSQPPTEPPPPTEAPPPTEPPPPPTVPEPPPAVTETQPEPPADAAAQPAQGYSEEAVNSFIKDAKILLYEDWHDLKYNRYVQKTLKEMGAENVTDVGSAMGDLKKYIIYKPPPGGWDIVIVAQESKGKVTGEFFDFIDEALKQNSSVILETWFLDKVSKGKVEILLRRCGVNVHRDWGFQGWRSQIMWPAIPEDPLLHFPKETVDSWTDVTDYWNFNADIGDLLQPTGEGDARVVVTSTTFDPVHNGTVTVCLGDQLILQTYSTHQLSWEAERLIWWNFIYHAAEVRMAKLGY